MKRVLAVCLCIILTCTPLLSTVSAESYQDSYCELIDYPSQVTRGQEFEVTFYLSNAEATRLVTANLESDANYVELIGGECLLTNVELGGVYPQYLSGTCLYKEARVVQGNIFTFRFKVKEDAPYGRTIIFVIGALGVNTGDYIDGTGAALEVVCNHNYGNMVNNGENHTLTCDKCGDVLPQAHTYDQQAVNGSTLATAATCTKPATYYYSCVCGKLGTETFTYGTTEQHVFNQQVETTEYYAGGASCSAQTTYYYSCTCGAKGTETFGVGGYLSHSYTDAVCTWCQCRLGDINGNGVINQEDVVALLLYITMPDMFSVGNATVDLNRDTWVNTEDAVNLLLYITMPDMFPLQ